VQNPPVVLLSLPIALQGYSAELTVKLETSAIDLAAIELSISIDDSSTTPARRSFSMEELPSKA
jgi:hypothetical protein